MVQSIHSCLRRTFISIENNFTLQVYPIILPEHFILALVLNPLIAKHQNLPSWLQMSARTLLKLIDDGEWHSLSDLAEKLKASPDEVIEMVKALSEYRVVEHEEEAEKVRLSSWVRNLPADVEVEEGKVALGSIILPPEGNITIQDTVISNFTDNDLELGIRIDKKLKELAISKVK